jgi:hypothetical protein
MSVTVRAARSRFFAQNGFAADGGYDDAWADAEFGPIAYRVPNLRARASALRIHDLHHLVTGYATSWRGEAEISAWELGSGWGRHAYAWVIALFGLFTGLLTQPMTTLIAFARGRRSANLYDRDSVDEVLDLPLSELERTLHVPASVKVAPIDLAHFVSTAFVAIAFGAVAIPFVVLFVIAGETRRAAMSMSRLARLGTCPFSA